MDELIKDWKAKIQDLENDREILYEELLRLSEYDPNKDPSLMWKIRCDMEIRNGLWDIKMAIKDIERIYSER